MVTVRDSLTCLDLVYHWSFSSDPVISAISPYLSLLHLGALATVLGSWLSSTCLVQLEW